MWFSLFNFKFNYDVFCATNYSEYLWLKTKDGESFRIEGYLEDNTGFLLLGSKSVRTIDYTCEELINMCQERLHTDYKYVQSAYPILHIPFLRDFFFIKNLSTWNGIIDKNDELCPYLRLSSADIDYIV